MRTTLDIDDEVLALVREMATADGRSIGTVLSELARRGLAPGRVDTSGGRPVIRVPEGTPVITPEMVRQADDEG